MADIAKLQADHGMHAMMRKAVKSSTLIPCLRFKCRKCLHSLGHCLPLFSGRSLLPSLINLPVQMPWMWACTTRARGLSDKEGMSYWGIVIVPPMQELQLSDWPRYVLTMMLITPSSPPNFLFIELGKVIIKRH
jgi:hypothetical protein